MKYENFFETTREAQTRLLGTIIMDYEDREPCVVHAITDHKKDKVFRIYTYRLGTKAGKLPKDSSQYGPEDPRLGEYLDKWLEDNKGSDVTRKFMNSPRWKNFKPFPLGMCNVPSQERPMCVYLERQPLRQREQGLTRAMIDESVVGLGAKTPVPSYGGRGPQFSDPYSEYMAFCIKGDYPTAEEVLNNLKNPDIANDSVAFHREFALIRGPVGTIFLGYKADVIGYMPMASFDTLLLAKGFRQLREKIEALKIFVNIR